MATSKKLTSLEGTAFYAGDVGEIVAGNGITVDSTDPTKPIVSASGGGGAEWGEITGTLADQTDLNAALNAKTTTIPPTTVALLPDGELGDITIATDGRKEGESAGNGTGVPVWSDGTSWLTFYGNTAVEA